MLGSMSGKVVVEQSNNNVYKTIVSQSLFTQFVIRMHSLVGNPTFSTCFSYLNRRTDFAEFARWWLQKQDGGGQAKA